ncbi:MAG: hypothetical protein Q4C87_06925 [Actinomycetaceae bacterium]|nr:hypothetical protein [Actinomycetaceae bacterium]
MTRVPTAAQRVLDAAVETLSNEGLSVSMDNIRMEEAIAASGASRASAYRRWPTKHAFAADVVVAAITQTTLLPESDSDLVQLTSLVNERIPDLATEQGRRNLVVESLRVSFTGDIHRLLASRRWRTLIALSAAQSPFFTDDLQRTVSEAIARTENELDAKRAEIYRQLTTILGYRIAPHMCNDNTDPYMELGTAMGSLMKGILLRAMASPQWLEERSECALFGSTEKVPWSAPERMLTSLLLTYLEPDPAIIWDQSTIQSALEHFHSLVCEMRIEADSPDESAAP